MLVYGEMKHVLHHLRHRYSFMKAKCCYTSISEQILIAVNPYEKLEIYGQDVMNEFHNAAQKGRLLSGNPHPYGICARAHAAMPKRKRNQSLILRGESGSGKVEIVFVWLCCAHAAKNTQNRKHYQTFMLRYTR